MDIKFIREDDKEFLVRVNRDMLPPVKSCIRIDGVFYKIVCYGYSTQYVKMGKDIPEVYIAEPECAYIEQATGEFE